MSRKIIGVTVGTPISPETLKKKLNIEPDSGGNVDLTGVVRSVNGQTPDENGNVEIAVSEVVTTVEPAYEDIPKIFFGGALQPTKEEKVVPFRYISKTEDISGYAEIKAQGNTSLQYPKKNQTVKMFKDAECTEKMKVDFKGWGKQNKHCYKANWIDLTHARNVVSARLWADVVKSRANYAELPELLRTSPNQGAVDGFPVKVYADGVYQGRYTLNIPKDKWMANMDDELDEHCILCGEGYTSGCFREVSIGQWTDEVHDSMPDTIKNRWLDVITFVMNSTDEEFRENLGNYFDITSLIDYQLFGLISAGVDAYGKNQLYMTYDGQKWIASMYDMDGTWGLTPFGNVGIPYDYPRTSYEDYVAPNSGDGNLLYVRLEQLFWAEMQTRWTELKNGALSIENIINHFERFTDIAPEELVKEDYASTTGGGKFTHIPGQTTCNIQQIRSFALARRAWTDEYVRGLVYIPCTGISLDTNTLNFTGTGTKVLTASVTPDGCTEKVTWESNNTGVATVVNGEVASVANGTATITAKCGNYSASCSVSVSGIAEPVPCTGISLDATKISFNSLNTTKTLTATVTPADTTDSIMWESSAPTVATVVNGVVTSVTEGSAVITAKCGEHSASCNVTISVVTTFDSFNDVSLYVGELSDSTGKVNTAKTNCRYTDMVDISKYSGMRIGVRYESTYLNYCRMHYYNKDSVWMKANGNNGYFVPPEDACYVRLALWDVGATAEVKAYVDIKSSGEVLEGSYKADGTYNPGDTNSCCIKIAIDPAETYRVKGAWGIRYYDANDNFISSDVNTSTTDVILTIPENAVSASFSFTDSVYAGSGYMYREEADLGSVTFNA